MSPIQKSNNVLGKLSQRIVEIHFQHLHLSEC